MLRRQINDNSVLSWNERGVALLIVLLITALLIALIFEFSYATRISLNSAVNFRNSQQADILAQSGIRAFIRGGKPLRDYFKQGLWHPLPIGDSDIEFIWWDESGKIKITNVKNEPTLSMARGLFENVKQIDVAVINNLVDQFNDVSKLKLLSGLRQYMSDEDFDKVKDSLTVSNVNPNLININAAPRDVLLGLGIISGDVDRIVKDRVTEPYGDLSNVPGIGTIRMGSGLMLSSYLTTTEGAFFKVTTSATVGGYTRQVEAIVSGNIFSYWRAL